MTTLVISRFVDGTETVVGTIQFKESGEPRLSTTGPTPERERLETIWKDVVARESIPMDVTERKEVDGAIISEFNSRLVAKGDAEYSSAVWSLLQSRYGYVVDLQQ
jgi:hypothetical protein